MSATSFKTLSMADSCLLSLPSFKSSSPVLTMPTRPIKLNLTLSCSFSLRKKTHFPSTVTFVSGTDEDNTATLEREEVGGGVEEEPYQEPSEDAKIFVGNLSYDVDSQRLASLFEDYGLVEIAEVIYNRETERSRGFGFVTFSSVEEAEKAVEKMNGYELDGRALTVNKAAKRGERVERPPRPFTPGFKVYVGNMSWDMDNARLEQIFSEHGKVEDARIVMDRETGRSRGFGFVTMANEAEMNDAIAALDGQNIDGRALRVNVAEERPRRF